MKFEKTLLEGAYVIELEKIVDDRGFFARAWCKDEFAKHSLTNRTVQANISLTKAKGTLRGLHFQIAPYEEAKVVRCTRGAIYDVIIDLRPQSPTFKNWFGVELTADNYRMLYVPERFAHGFQTLQDETEVYYEISEYYVPDAARGIRYDDDDFSISWPLPVVNLSEQDANWPDFDG